MIGFWNRLITGKQNKISFTLYQTFYNHEKSFKWIEFVKGIFLDIGRTDIWIYQSNIDTRNLNKEVKYGILVVHYKTHRKDVGDNFQYLIVCP